MMSNNIITHTYEKKTKEKVWKETKEGLFLGYLEDESRDINVRLKHTTEKTEMCLIYLPGNVTASRVPTLSIKIKKE